MIPITVNAARQVAERFDYDQVIIIGRKVDQAGKPGGESVATYGVDKANCDVAARIGNFLKFKVMGWKDEVKS